MRFHLIPVGAAAAMFCFAMAGPSAAGAAVTLFSDEGAFVAALTSASLEDFNDPAFTPGWAADCTNCSVDLASGRLLDQAQIGIGQRTRINFTTPINAWGATFDETPGGFGKGLFISYRLTDGFTTLTAGPQLNGYTGQFFGFISDDPFVFVGISAGVNPAASSERYAMDNMRFGVGRAGAVPAAGGVPEPAAWALMIAGFATAGAILRRRASAAVPS